MKGKGKGERTESKDCPLQFPELEPIDHALHCRFYTSVLQRSNNETIGIEEIDVLRSELETLLSSIAKRMRQLETEIQVLTNWQEKGKDKGKQSPQQKPVSETPAAHSGKRYGGKIEEKPNKKLKETPNRVVQPSPPSVSRNIPRGKLQTVKQEEICDSGDSSELNAAPSSSASSGPRPSTELPKMVKNEMPGKFWAMVEPYCADITNEDMKALDEVTKLHEDETNAEFYRIPPLGKHYTEKWAQEDLLDEKKEGCKQFDKKKASNGLDSSTPDPENILKKTSDIDADAPLFGPLTQRLVQALIEENVMSPLDEATGLQDGDQTVDSTTATDSCEQAAGLSPRSLAKQMNVGNTSLLEKRIRKELEEQGILDLNEQGWETDDDEDEVLAELMKKQAELKALSHRNLSITKRLHDSALREIKRQELRKKLSACDEEVLETYRKVQTARQRKRTPTKKEKETAFKAIKEREVILKQLESLGEPPLFR